MFAYFGMVDEAREDLKDNSGRKDFLIFEIVDEGSEGGIGRVGELAREEFEGLRVFEEVLAGGDGGEDGPNEDLHLSGLYHH